MPAKTDRTPPDQPCIRLQNSLIRNLLFPIYGVDQAVFTFALLAISYSLFRRLDPAFAPTGVIGGWVGAVAMSLTTAPAAVVLTQTQFLEVLKKLSSMGFVHDETAKTWTAPLPRWLRWKHAYVSHEEAENGCIRLKGPRLFLRNLLPLAEDRLFITPLW